MLDLTLTETPLAPRRIRLDSVGGHVALAVEDGLLLLELTGAARLGRVREALATARQAGWLDNALPTLVDLTGFSGNVDWEELRAITHMADWPPPDGRSLPVAYVSDATLVIMLVKVAQAFFPWARHRVFSRRDWALDWLREKTTDRAGG